MGAFLAWKDQTFETIAHSSHAAAEMFVFVPAPPSTSFASSVITKRASANPSSSRRPSTFRLPPHPARARANPIMTSADLNHNPSPAANLSLPQCANSLQPGVVVELWSAAQLHFALVRSVYDKGIIVDLATGTAGLVSTTLAVKKSFDEIVSVWPHHINPSPNQPWPSLVADVERGLAFLRNSSPRTLDLTVVHARLSRASKGRTAPPQSSADIAKLVFPAAFNPTQPNSDASRELRASATVAGAILVASDSIRFKRAAPGAGWRVLPVSVTEARQRSSFVDKCKAIMDGKANAQDPALMWTREQLELLREIQIVAASGTAASGTAATALRSLGYEENDNGATRLLLDIQYWARGKPASDMVKKFKRDKASERTPSVPGPKENQDPPRNSLRNGYTARDWTFPQQILDEAKEVRKAARSKRASLRELNAGNKSEYRRNLRTAKGGPPAEVYCIDDKKSRFLDDAFSVIPKGKEGLVRVSVHIADVDEVVTSGSAIDRMARDRGESLYLPLKPLHMLPATVMEAASFDTTMATEAITVSIDVDIEHQKVRNWEVFASVVPPVTRVDYDQFDLALQADTESVDLTTTQSRDLRLIAKAAPILCAKLDERKPTRRRRRRTDPLDSPIDTSTRDTLEANGIAAVRLVNKSTSSSRTVKVAEVVDFRSTGSHVTVDDILTSAGALLRKFAKENNAHLPEGQDASSYVARCGTAPLRRYLDLAIQRQIKCVLFGRQPAGRRRMHELRTWLAKRHSAGERTVAEKRRSALFDSFSNHCARQRVAAGLEYAVVKGRVLNGSVTKNGKVRFVVSLVGTGLSTTASVSPNLLRKIQSVDLPGKTSGSESNGAALKDSAGTKNYALAKARAIVPYQSKVRIAVQDVDISAQRIQALITEVL